MIVKCPLCHANVLSHSVSLQCCLCSSRLHAACLSLTSKDVTVLSTKPYPWICSDCNGCVLPFNQCINDDSFSESLFEFYHDGSITLSTIRDLVFNPFSLNEKNNIPLFEADPDVNFFNDNCTKVNNSNYMFEDQFNELVSGIDSQNQFSILHLNIRSLPAHRLELESLLHSLKMNFTCIGLSETWLNDISCDITGID